eukprot:CAMPEP_0204566942 /NCGR_PEP_ID=MMETSP0661-20131031/36328_1 /ASSEMBLY_ACC=CAM_ASM_000606 /TAXON_ID=109239 /ORGANISM="Alexandrium margalefi, Strain AMGDE01CS-322" /LENGTH=206 /DNA_ID=CAMNT_0051574817 /DNA_START=35 /DNA_END=651 /DNA_ORIENTATION=+
MPDLYKAGNASAAEISSPPHKDAPLATTNSSSEASTHDSCGVCRRSNFKKDQERPRLIDGGREVPVLLALGKSAAGLVREVYPHRTAEGLLPAAGAHPDEEHDVRDARGELGLALQLDPAVPLGLPEATAAPAVVGVPREYVDPKTRGPVAGQLDRELRRDCLPVLALQPPRVHGPLHPRPARRNPLRAGEPVGLQHRGQAGVALR